MIYLYHNKRERNNGFHVLRNFEHKKSEESSFQTLFFQEKNKREFEKSFKSKKILSEKTFSTGKKCRRFDVSFFFYWLSKNGVL